MVLYRQTCRGKSLKPCAAVVCDSAAEAKSHNSLETSSLYVYAIKGLYSHRPVSKERVYRREKKTHRRKSREAVLLLEKSSELD